MSETTIYYGRPTANQNVLLRQVRIMEHRIDSPSGFDNPSTGIMRHTITGEALVFKEQGEYGQNPNRSSQNFLIKMKEVLNTPRLPLRISVVGDGQNNRFDIIDTTAANARTQDDLGGPFFRASIVQITGTNTLLVNFTIEFAQASNNSSGNRIRSFFCQSTFSIDEVGMTTIRKTGSIQLVSRPSYDRTANRIAPLATDKAGAPNTATLRNRYPGGDDIRTDVVVDFVTSAGAGDFADYYRRLVSGNLYRGFRRIRQEYAIDETRTRMMFDITDQEFSRGLPAPARVGDCSYTFERSLNENQILGIKHFIASVKGDRNVAPGALLTLCIRLSQNRIDYKNDLITTVRVSEQNMLTENSITFEIMATATSAQVFTPTSSDGNNGDAPTNAGSGTIVDESLLLKNILSPIKMAGSGGVFQFTPAPQADSYGSALIVRVTPSAYDHQSVDATTLALPTTRQLSEENPVIYQFPNAVFDSIEGQQPDGINRYIDKYKPFVERGPNRGDSQVIPENPEDRERQKREKVLHSKGNRSVKVDTGIIRVPSVSGSGGDAIFQISAPFISIDENQNSARMNVAPQRLIEERSSNTGSFLTQYSFAGTSGSPDLNGNRVLSANFGRSSIQTCPTDVPANSGSSPTNPEFQRVTAQLNGRSYSLIRYYPTTFDMPNDETQGRDEASRPSYTAGLGAPEVLA
jgi:hypothetical protein